MNGFAAEGFAKGLLGGLDAADGLANSAHRRRLLDEESSYKKRYYDAEAIKHEMEAQKLQNETAMKQRAAQAPQALQIGQRIMNGEDVTEDDIKTLGSLGINFGSIADDDYVDQIRNTMDLVKSGKLNPEDPIVAQVMSPVLGHKIQRNIGGVSVDPNGNVPIRVTEKNFAGLVKNPKDPSSFGVRVRVKGVDSDGNVREYEDLASQHGTSSPDDPYAFFTTSQLEGPFAATVALNHGLSRNPKNRELVQQYIQGSVIDPEAQAKIDLKNAQVGTEQSKQGANQALAEERRSNVGLNEARSSTETNKQGKYDAQAGYYDRGNRPKPDKASKPKGFDESLASKQASRFIPTPPPKYPGAKAEDTPEVVNRRKEHIATVRDLMTVGKIEDQHEAARIAEQGERVERQTQDGKRFRGIRFIDSDGKAKTVPLQWLN
jgi:hypothetical protein